MEEGKKIYVESLLTEEEWKQVSKKYPETSSSPYPEFFKSEMAWRHRMGSSLPAEEIRLINQRMDKVLKEANLHEKILS